MIGQTASEGSTGTRSLAICRAHRRRRLRKRKKVRHSMRAAAITRCRFPEDHQWFCGLGWLFFFSFSFFCFCFFSFSILLFFFLERDCLLAQFAIRGYAPVTMWLKNEWQSAMHTLYRHVKNFRSFSPWPDLILSFFLSFFLLFFLSSLLSISLSPHHPSIFTLPIILCLANFNGIY